ncbi:hypothetical protein OQA88_13345 [Cercophora sp. LCS_1]
MHLLNLPTEIRLQIYAKLLVLNRPIQLGTDQDPYHPRLWTRTTGLSPAILRVNKQIHSEATPFLYSNNRFKFPDTSTTTNDDSDSWASTEAPCFAPFVRQIKANASLLRHIRVDIKSCLPETTWATPVVLSEGWIDLLKLLKTACPHLNTVEMLSESSDGVFTLFDADLAASMLRLLHEGGFKEMSSLEKIVVVHEVRDLDEKALAARGTLMGMLPSCTWSIQLTQAPAKTWVSWDDRFEFETEEECRAYDNESWRREMEREERLEQELWEEEYYCRRADPYWKNDSDYD